MASESELVAAVAALNPVAASGNDAVRRLGGNRAAVLKAFRVWRRGGGTAAPETGTAAAVSPPPVDAAVVRERARRRLWLEADEWPP